MGNVRDDCTVLLWGRFDITQMGRMHSGGKGISKSSLPYKRSPPSWLKISAQEVTDHVCKLAKKGLTPSQVGVSENVERVGGRLVLDYTNSRRG